MTFKEYVKSLNDLLEENPEYGEYTVITSSDDEGNSYNEVYYGPGIGCFRGGDEFVHDDAFDEYEDESLVSNAVCVN